MKLRETIKKVLREETKPHKAMRRTHLIDYEIERMLNNPYLPKNVCKKYGNPDEFIISMCEHCAENLYFNTFYMMDDTSEEWEKSVDFIYDYVKDSYRGKLTNYYNKNCKG